MVRLLHLAALGVLPFSAHGVRDDRVFSSVIETDDKLGAEEAVNSDVIRDPAKTAIQDILNSNAVHGVGKTAVQDLITLIPSDILKTVLTKWGSLHIINYIAFILKTIEDSQPSGITTIINMDPATMFPAEEQQTTFIASSSVGYQDPAEATVRTIPAGRTFLDLGSTEQGTGEYEKMVARLLGEDPLPLHSNSATVQYGGAVNWPTVQKRATHVGVVDHIDIFKGRFSLNTSYAPFGGAGQTRHTWSARKQFHNVICPRSRGLVNQQPDHIYVYTGGCEFRDLKSEDCLFPHLTGHGIEPGSDAHLDVCKGMVRSVCHHMPEEKWELCLNYLKCALDNLRREDVVTPSVDCPSALSPLGEKAPHRGSKVKNRGKDCHSSCGERDSGPCPEFCGVDGLCCRVDGILFKTPAYEANGCGGRGGWFTHQCVGKDDSEY